AARGRHVPVPESCTRPPRAARRLRYGGAMRRYALLPLLAAAAAAQSEAPAASAPAAQGLILDAALHHLGDDRTPEWSEVSAEPEGVKLELRFTGHATGAEQ